MWGTLGDVILKRTVSMPWDLKLRIIKTGCFEKKKLELSIET
jgi:hypothetical protein